MRASIYLALVLCLSVGVSAVDRQYNCEQVIPVEDFRILEAKATNVYRALHIDTPPIELDETLNQQAQAYADQLVQLNAVLPVRLVHDTNTPGLGENLYWSDSKDIVKGGEAAQAWYNQYKDYDYSTATSSTGYAIGHFTQLVWVKSIKMGCGRATMPSRQYSQYGNTESFVVCKYSPQGNFYYYGQRLQDYTANVKPRKAGAVVPTLKQIWAL